MIVVTIDSIRITFIISNASQKAFITLETDASQKVSDTSDVTFKNIRQSATSSMAGKNTAATAIIPTTPTLERINDEYDCIDSKPSLIALPITGTTELIANLIERRPIASALDATAVLIDKTETKAAAQTETAVVIYFFINATAP